MWSVLWDVMWNVPRSALRGKRSSYFFSGAGLFGSGYARLPGDGRNMTPPLQSPHASYYVLAPLLLLLLVLPVVAGGGGSPFFVFSFFFLFYWEGRVRNGF